MKREGDATRQKTGREQAGGSHGLWREFPTFDPFGRRCFLGVRGPHLQLRKSSLVAQLGGSKGGPTPVFARLVKGFSGRKRRDESTDSDVAG
jgi:hypothetical protein